MININKNLKVNKESFQIEATPNYHSIINTFCYQFPNLDVEPSRNDCV